MRSHSSAAMRVEAWKERDREERGRRRGALRPFHADDILLFSFVHSESVWHISLKTQYEAASCDGDDPAWPFPFAWKFSPADTADAEPRWDDVYPVFPPLTAWPPSWGYHCGHPGVGKEACLLPHFLLWPNTHISLLHTGPNSTFLRNKRWCGQRK